MASNVRLRSEGIRVLSDRITFARFSHFLSDGDDNDYNFDIGNGSLVAENSVTISGNLTVSSPGVLRELGFADVPRVVQTMRFTNTILPQWLQFRAASDGVIIKMSAVYWAAEADATDQFWVYLSDGGSLFGENPIKYGPVAGGWAAYDVATTTVVGGPSYPDEEALRRVSRGDLRYLLSWPIGTGANDCTVVIEIEPAAET